MPKTVMRRRVAILSLLSLPAMLLVAAGTTAAAAPGTVTGPARTAAASPSSLGTFPPTFAGSAATGCPSGCHLLAGPFRAASTAHAFAASPAIAGDSAQRLPLFPRARFLAGAKGAVRLPTVSCAPQGRGCDTIGTSAGGAVGVKGLNAVDSATHTANIFKDVEPPDQGLCAGNGNVVETNNIGEILVFNKALKRLSQPISDDAIMGLTQRHWSSGGDPSCLYDSADGGHWFFTEIVSASPESKGGPFVGCFAAKANGCYEGIAVTAGSSPFGPYNVYFLKANYDPAEPGYPYLLNDFAKISASRDAFLMFYDEFPLKGNGIGGGFFNGAQEFAFNKNALEQGRPAADVTVARENMGLIPTPNGTCARDNKLHQPSISCWFSVIPAVPQSPAAYDNNHGGTAFMLGTLDYYNLGDNRLAVWDWTGLKALNSSGCSACSGIRFGGQLFSNVLRYYDNGSLPSGMLAPQKAGPIPLGDECGKAGLSVGKPPPNDCPEGGIATNGDNITQAAQAQGQLWAGANTALEQTYGTSVEQHMGAVYWVVGTRQFDSSGQLSLTSQGYVSPMHEDIEFPALAADNTGPAVMSFTLNGNGGPFAADNGGFYPSSAFGRLTSTSGGLLKSTVNIADLGQSPQDGFTEYQGYPGTTRPRWGDYGAAVAMGGRVYFASEYIQYPNCHPPEFTLTVGTCGGTRDGNANWGTSVNYVTP